MAYVFGHPGAQTVFSRIVASVEGVKVAVARRKLYLATLRELNELTDEELADLDISRSMIRRLAVEAAYGN